MRRKALLALVFAGGMFSSPPEASSEPLIKAESTDSVIQRIANSNQITPELKAFYLLQIANSYLSGENRSQVKAQYAHAADSQTRSWSFSNSRSWEKIFGSWANQLSVENSSKSIGIRGRTETKAKSQSISAENSALAVTAVEKALTQLDSASEQFAKLNMYYIASQLFQKMGNTDGIRRCNKVLEAAFQSCEKQSPIEEEKVKAASSVMNSMAISVIPVNIPDRWQQKRELAPFIEDDFKRSEKLKRRAINLVDKLPADNHERRKAHRDLVLWYTQLGKTEMAEKEKLVLFELVGIKSDSILYPQEGACGHLVWWEKERPKFQGACGMG